MEVAKMSEKESKKKARRYTAAQKKEVVESAKSGMSLQELVDKYPMGKRAIMRYLKNADIKLKK